MISGAELQYQCRFETAPTRQVKDVRWLIIERVRAWLRRHHPDLPDGNRDWAPLKSFGRLGWLAKGARMRSAYCFADDGSGDYWWALRIEEWIDGGPDPLTGGAFARQARFTQIGYRQRGPERHGELSVMISTTNLPWSLARVRTPEPPGVPEIVRDLVAVEDLQCNVSDMPIDNMVLGVGTGERRGTGGLSDLRNLSGMLWGRTEMFWERVKDPTRTYPIVYIGTDADGNEVVDPKALNDAIFPNALICHPADAGAEERLRAGKPDDVRCDWTGLNVWLPRAKRRKPAVSVAEPAADQGTDSSEGIANGGAGASGTAGSEPTGTPQEAGTLADATPITADADGPDAAVDDTWGLDEDMPVPVAAGHPQGDATETDGTDRAGRHAKTLKWLPDRYLSAEAIANIRAEENAHGVARLRWGDKAPDPVVLIVRRMLIGDMAATGHDEFLTVERVIAIRDRRIIVSKMREAQERQEEMRRENEELHTRFADALAEHEDNKRRSANLDERVRLFQMQRRRSEEFDRLQADEKAGLRQQLDEAHQMVDEMSKDCDKYRRDTEAAFAVAGQLEERNDLLQHELEQARSRADEAEQRLRAHRLGGGRGGAASAAEMDPALLPVMLELPALLSSGLKRRNEETARKLAGLLMRMYPGRIHVMPDAFNGCITNPDLVWQGLWCMCTAVYDIYAKGQGGGNADERFRRTPGVPVRFELALSEGKNTNRNARLTKMRRIQYHGRTIDITPHLKAGGGNDSETTLRIYYCWDETDATLVIGHIGTHLTNDTTINGRL